MGRDVMRRNRKPGFNTRAIHHGHDPSAHQGALEHPVYMTSTYVFDSAEEAAQTFAGEREAFAYGRTKNPTQALLEERIAELEGAEAGLVTASGMGAIASLLWTRLRPGDGLVAHHTLYGNSYTLIAKELPEFGIGVRLVDLTEPANLAEALTGTTRMVYCETPANPNLDIVDIGRISAMAREAGAITVVDNTFATPAAQRPLESGADAVIHSMTKFLGGHSDVLAGALVGSKGLVKDVRMRGLRYLTGAAIAPLSAFLVLRGMKTLGVRLERHSQNALVLAQMLESHPKVRKVRYPGLPSHPQHALSERQMSLPGGLLAFELRGGLEAGRRFLDKLTLASRAVSLGGCETLAQHPASMTHTSYRGDALARFGLSEGLIRVSVGLEDIDDLTDDFAGALDRA